MNCCRCEVPDLPTGTHIKSYGRTGLTGFSLCTGVFASGGEDQLIAVWDLERTGETTPAAAAAASAAGDEEQEPGLPPQLIFQHAGHRSQVSLACFQMVKLHQWQAASIASKMDPGRVEPCNSCFSRG